MKALPNILTGLRLLLGLAMFLCLAGAAGGRSQEMRSLKAACDEALGERGGTDGGLVF